jgi:hypothetical protein
MPEKRLQFDVATWHALDLLAKDRMQDFQELAVWGWALSSRPAAPARPRCWSFRWGLQPSLESRR